MSGHLFKNVAPISQREFWAIWPKLEALLFELGARDIEPVGSGATCVGFKPIGDIDVVASHSLGRSGLLSALERRFQVRKTGKDLVSFSYPCLDRDAHVQVDVFVGDPKYLMWSKAGEIIDGIKGSTRALLWNATLNVFSCTLFKNNSELDRQRYALDFGSGLNLIVQTKRSKCELCKKLANTVCISQDQRRRCFDHTPTLDGGGGMSGDYQHIKKPCLKNWKTIQTTLITANPQTINDIVFRPGDNIPSDQTKTFSGLINAINSGFSYPHAVAIKTLFKIDLEMLDKKHPGSYGDVNIISQHLNF